MNSTDEPESPLPPDSASTDPDGVLPHSEPAVEPSRTRMWVMCAVGFLAFGVVYILMVAAGGEFRKFASAGLEACPFAILTVLAYASHPKGIGGRVLTVTYWSMLVGAVGLGSIALTIVGILHIPLGVSSFEAIAPPTIEQILRIVAACLALAAAGGLGLLCFSTGIRRRAATWFDVDPQSFVHATALATTVTMTLMCTIPLLAVNEPLIMWLFNPESGSNLAESESIVGSTLYGLMWAVPASFVAVGFPIKRTLREAQLRLALVWPSRLQVVVAIAIAIALVLAVGPVEFLINALWKALGLRVTDASAVEALFKGAMQPAGAVIVGISAGLGEELAFRGVLQPRLGIVLPALLFTALHAFQYDFDALIWILFLGLLLGLVRKKTNTTTCVLIHAAYDLMLLLAAHFFGS